MGPIEIILKRMKRSPKNEHIPEKNMRSRIKQRNKKTKKAKKGMRSLLGRQRVNKERESKIRGRPEKAMAIVHKIDEGGLIAERGFIHRYPSARVLSSSSAQ
ncbi:MAG: hypothetical protein ACOC6P_04600 [Candidatus Aminicenantaceae bacterium]